ncbi:unnamed protein product, partial [Mesorhabditis belari]|uniref:Uncharacterized protein n=1 Tax=Mesorhabditis belari TaxID=2138241 RepID=A0AAF3J4Z2_9BILA
MTDVAPTSPKLEDLPKIDRDIAKALVHGVELKKVETHEKQVLPSPTEIIQEKTHNEICDGITHFTPERLRRTSTDEKQVLPTPQDIKQEKQHQELTHNIEEFDSGKLNPVSTEEKVILPSKEDILREKAPVEAAHFDKSALKHVEPQVKHGCEVVEAQ